MGRKSMVRRADVRGLSRLLADATLGVAGVAESMQAAIADIPLVRRTPPARIVAAVTRLTYRGVRGVTRAVAGAAELALAFKAAPPASGHPDDELSPPAREAALAALNGVLGDHLAATANPLALPMALRRDGRTLELSPAGLASAIPDPSGRILLLAHGLCMNDLQWRRRGHDHGAALAAELGFTPVYLRYNSGLHISANGRQLAALLDELVAAWPVPVEDLTIVGHSMGGLVARSACHHAEEAGHGWRRHLRSLAFLATPHHGSPLERGGNWADILLGSNAYTAALARIGKIRSAGITDLRYASLRDEDWSGGDRFRRGAGRGEHLPLPAGVDCYAIGATSGRAPGDPRDRLLGDGLVPLASALGRHADPARSLPIPADRQWIGAGMNHFDVLSSPEVYRRLLAWLAP